jgi:hypothetical protein
MVSCGRMVGRSARPQAAIFTVLWLKRANVPAVLLETTYHADLQPLLLKGVPVFHNLAQIQTELCMVLSEEHFALFAVPSAERSSGDISWHAPSAGARARLADLAPPVRVAVEARLAELVREIAEHAAKLLRSQSEIERQVGSNLTLALEIPDESHIFAVAGRPVIAAWGHLPHGPATPQQLLIELARRIEQDTAAPPVTSAPSSAPPKGIVEDKADVVPAAPADVTPDAGAGHGGRAATEANRAADATEPAANPSSTPAVEAAGERPPPETQSIRRRLDDLRQLEQEFEQHRQADEARRRAGDEAARQGEPAAAPSAAAAVPPAASVLTAPEVAVEAPSKPANTPAADAVEFGLSHPWGVAHGVPFLVEAWVFPPQERLEAERRAIATEPEAIGSSAGGAAALPRATELAVSLAIASWKVEPEVQTLAFAGTLARVWFSVTPSADVPGGRAAGALTFRANGIRVAQLPVQLSLAGAPLPQKRFLAAPASRTAFASYALRDRARVLSRVQGIEKFGVDVFVDIRNGEGDDPYPAHLLEKIDSADVVFLFWSRRAQQSKWVEREWRHALESKGLDFIEPVPLADPRKVALPEALVGDKHSDDWMRGYLAYEESLGPWRRLGLWLAGYRIRLTGGR